MGEQMKELFKNAWLGKEKLWKVFWLIGWVFPLVLSVLLAFLEKAFANTVMAIIVSIFMIAYSIYSLIAVWKCARNTKNKIWFYLARFYVILAPLLIVLGLLLGAVLVGQDLIHAARCRKANVDYVNAINAGADPNVYLQQHSQDFSTCPNGQPINQNNQNTQ